MPGMTTLGKLYLGSEPTGVTVENDHLCIMLADGRNLALPLQWVGQLNLDKPLPAESQLLILQRPPQIDRVQVTDTTLNVYLKDGRLLACPLAWFPRLLYGTAAERNHFQLSGNHDVIHWPDLDEDIELSRLFEGGKSVETTRSLQRWLRSRQKKASPELVAA